MTNKAKQKIIDYAKELYTSYDADGSKLYSLREISTKIKQKFNKEYNYSTVGNWAKKFAWNKLNEKIKQQSISKAQNVKFTAEEQIIEKESDLLAEIYKYAEQGTKLGYREIFAILDKNQTPVTDVNIRDLISLIKLNTDIIFRINDIPEVFGVKTVAEIDYSKLSKSTLKKLESELG